MLWGISVFVLSGIMMEKCRFYDGKHLDIKFVKWENKERNLCVEGG